MRDAVILNEEPLDFSKEFYDALIKWFKDDRINGYQRVYLDDDEWEEFKDDKEYWTEEYFTIVSELRTKGYTEEHILLVDNSW